MSRPGPDNELLKKLVAKGLEYEDIAEELRLRTGYATTAKNIGVYISRNRERLHIPRRVDRYDDLIPWQIHPRHVRHYDLRMLRLQARLDRGQPIEQEWAVRLERWKQRLAEQDGVVAYYWHTADGFYWVPRRNGDLGLIRPIVGVEQDIREMAGAS